MNHRELLLETCEDRILCDAAPDVTLTVPDKPKIGDTVQVKASFDNTSTTDTGFGPYIDLIIDKTGADGSGDGSTAATAHDGLTFLGATYLGQNVTATVLTFDALGHATHPYAKDASGAALVVTAPPGYGPGDQMIVLQLPYGSFSPSQPPADVLINLQMSNKADVNMPLNISARGGFQYGNDALDNPATDPSIIDGSYANASLIPSLMTVSKNYLGPENETATGPNFVQQYQLVLDVANGQTLNNVHLVDVLAAAGVDAHQFVSLDSVTVGGSAVSFGTGYTLPSGTPSTSTPGGTLDVLIPTVSGTNSTQDAVVTFSFYVPRVNGAAAIINASTGDDNIISNQALGYGSWTPLDTRDATVTVSDKTTAPGGTTPDTASEHDLEAQSIAIQKGVTSVIRNGVNIGTIASDDYLPGDVVVFTINFQISDYFAFQNLSITDVMSDGLHLDTSAFSPTLSINGNTYALGAATMAGGNYTQTIDTDGIYNNGVGTGDTTLNFNISAELAARAAGITATTQAEIADKSYALAGQLLGGGVNPLNPNGAIGNTLPAYNAGATTGQIVYRAVILDKYTDTAPGAAGAPSTEASLDPRDQLTNSATIQGAVLDLAAAAGNANNTDGSGSNNVLVPTGNTEADDTGNLLAIRQNEVQKEIYAINGVLNGTPAFNAAFRAGGTATGAIHLQPDDDVTYRITYTVPTGDVEHLRFTDYLPSPIFSATDPDADGTPSGFTFDNNIVAGDPTAVVPATGHVTYGPTHTLNDVATINYDSGIPDVIALSTDSVSNSLTFNIGTTVDTTNTARTIDLLFTVTVGSKAFADGLFLTNQVQSGERNTRQPNVVNEANSNAIIKIVLDQPEVTINKGVIASTQNGVAPATGGLTFNPVSGNGFTGTLVGGANATAIGALDLTTGTLPDAGDVVRFALVAQNTGAADAFDVTVQDTIRGSYANNFTDAATFAAGTIFKVYSGSGSLLTLGVDYSLTWNNTTKTFVVALNDTPTQGKLSRGVDAASAGSPQTTDGSNAVVITYDLTVDTDASTGSTVTNTASLTSFTNKDGATGPGTNHAEQPLTETANVKINTPTFTKVLVGTEINAPGNNGANQAVVGELVTYTVTVTVPEGTTSGASIVDILDPGLAFVGVTGVSTTPGVTASIPTISTTPANTTITNSGGTVTFNLGTITNSNTNNATQETITITYTAVVLNTNTAPSTPGNQSGTALNNSATLASTHTDDTGTASTPVANTPITASANNVTVVEPTVTVSNSLSTDNTTYTDNGTVQAVAGQDVYYKVVLTNTSSVAAHDISMYDRLPAIFDLANTSIISVTSSSGASDFDTNAAGGFANFAIGLDTAFGNNKPALYTTGALASLAPGETLTIVVKSRVVDNAVAASTNPNGIQVRWTSMDNNVRSTDATDTAPTGITMGGSTTQVPRSAYNANSVERTGSDGPPTDPATAYFALNNYAATDDLTNTILQITPVQLQKELLGTQVTNANNTATQAVVGEYATYRITFAIPKGTTNNFVLTDVIDPGMAFAQLVSVTGGPNVTTNVDGSGNPTANSIYSGNSAATNLANLQGNTTITLNGTRVVINLGNVTNDEVAATPGQFVPPQQIEIVYQVLVTNVVANQSGQIRNNIATIDYDSIADTTPVHIQLSDTPATPVTIIEPTLVIAKSASTTANVDAGDTVTFTTTIQHAGTSGTDAYDLTFSDPLSAFLASATTGLAFANSDLGTSITITHSSLGNISSQFEIVGGILQTKSTANVDLLKGQTITITVTARIADSTPAGQFVNNTARVNWTSIDGAPTVSSYTADDTERDGSNGTGGLNDYTASSSAGVNVATPTVDKKFKDGVASTANTYTDVASTTGANVVIGEQITYDLLVTLPEGVTNNVRVQDVIPAGLRVDTIQILTAAGSSALLTNSFNGTFGTTPALGAPTSGATTLALNFGNITVASDNVTGNNQFVVRVTATVLNILTSQQGVNIANTGRLLFNDPDGATPSVNGTAVDRTINDTDGVNPTVTIVEPTVTVVKNVTGPANPDAGDVLTYSITLTNTSGQTAYEVTLSDAISSNLTSASLVSISTSGGTAALLSDFGIFNESGVFVLRTAPGANIDMANGSSITLTYTATVASATGPTATISNTANVRWSSLNGGVDGDDAGTINERNGSGVADPAPTALDQTSTTGPADNYALSSSVVTTTTNSVVVNKSIVTTSQGGNDGVVTPGEVVTYQMTVTLPEGVAPDLQIKDNLPLGMAYLPGSITLVSTGFNGTVSTPVASPISSPIFDNGRDVLFDFSSITTTADNVTTNNTFTFTYQAVVLDVASNVGTGGSQTILTNTATHNNGGVDPAFGSSAGSGSVTVVEPQLVAQKSVVVNGSGTTGDAGDPVSYTVVLRHNTPVIAGADSKSDAYNVTFNDPLPSQFTPNSATSFTVTHSTLGDVSNRFELVELTPGNWTLRTIAGQSVDLALTDQMTVSVSGVLNSTVTPNQTVSNTASIAYTSYPGDRTAPGGFNPNPDVTTDHERAYTASGSANLTGSAATFNKSLFATNQVFTTGANAAIGEQVTYALKVTLPEGTTPDLSILDELPPGLQYVPGSALVVTTAAASGGLLAADFNGTISFPTVSGGAADGSDVNITFGAITNTGDNVSNNNSFIILITARVTNTTGNQTGTVLHNDAVFDISTDGVAAFKTPNVDVTVVEPHVNVTKNVLSATTGIDAFDSVTYQVTLNNLAANGATTDAFDVALSDILPPGLTITSIGAPTLAGGSTLDTALSGVGGGTLSGQFDIPLGGSVTFTYTVVVANTVTPNQTLTSDLNVTFSSLNGTDPNERTGGDVADPEDNTPQNNDTVRNNYAVGADATITTAAPFSVGKSLINTSLGNDTSLNVVVGETLTYQLAVSVMEGTTNNLSLVDTLPQLAGVNQLTYVPGSFVVTNANGMTITGLTVAYNSSTNQLTITANSVVNPGNVDNAAAADTDTFLVTYQVQVADVALNQSGTNLTNDVDATATGVPPDSNNQITVNVREPVLGLTKTTTTPGTDGGDNVVYTLVLTNTGNATAYDINIKDTLDAALQLVTPGSALTVTGGTGAGYGILTQGGNTSALVNSILNRLDAGDTIIITIAAQVKPGAVAGDTISNTASIDYSSLPGTQAGERTGAGGVDDYATSASSADFTLSRPTIDKLTPADTTYSIGETVTYDIVVTVPEGTTNNLVVTDNLPAGLVYTGAQIITSAASSGGLLSSDFAGTVGMPAVGNPSGNIRTFDFGNVVATANGTAGDNTFILRVTAYVDNISTNQGAGSPGTATQFSNTATLQYNDGTTGIRTVTDPTTPGAITVVEPVLNFNKTVTTPTTGLDAGDTVSYQVTISNTGTATAQDVNFADSLPVGMIISSGGLSSSGGVTIDGSGGGVGQNSVNFQFTIPVGGTVTITYSAVLPNTVTPGSALTNNATVNWSSIDGTDAHERTGTDGTQGGGTLNDYSLNSSVTVNVANPFSVTKTLTNTSLGNDTSTTVAVGETLTYQIAVTVVEGTTNDLHLQDALPAGLVYVPGSAVITNANGITVNGFNVAYNPGTNQLTLAATSVVNPGGSNSTTNDASTAETDTFFITYQVRVADVPGNTSGTTLTNDVDGTATGVPPDNNNQVTVTVQEPSLTIDKSFDVTEANAGDTIQVTITVTNNGTGTAFDSRINDTIDGTRFDRSTFASVTAPAGWTPSYDPVTGLLTFTDTNAAGLAVGATATFTFNIDLRSALPPGAVVSNTASATTTTLPGVDANERTEDPVSDTATLNASATVALDKTLQSTSETGTTGSDVAIGEVATFRLTVTLGEGVTSIVIFNDNLPAGLGYNTGAGIFRAVTPGATAVGLVSGILYTDGSIINAADVAYNAGTGALSFSLVNATIPSGSSTGSGQFAIEYQTTAQDVLSNQNGTALTNGASVAADLNDDGDSDDVGETSATSSQTLNVVEPALTVTKTSNDADGVVTAGETVTYTLTITNGGTATAYDVLLRDVIPAGLQYVAGSATYVSGVTPDASSLAVTGGILSANFSSLAVGQSTTITFQAVVQATGSLQNNARIFYDGLAGDEPDNSVITQTADGTPDRDYGADGGFDGTVETPAGNTDPAQDTELVTLGTGSIGDTVWFDQNGNGLQEANEPGLADVTVTLTGINPDSTTFTLTTTTDATGHYTFSNLASDAYTVAVNPATIPGGATTIATFDLDGTGTANTTAVTLTNGQTRTDADFGYRGTGTLGDTVWLDLDASGTQNGQEPGIANVTVDLVWDANGNGSIDAGDTVLGTVTTDSTGQYSFGNLLAGKYLAQVTDTNGVLTGATATFDLDGAAATPGITAATLTTSTQALTTVDFGYRGDSSISGTSYHDQLKDGTFNGTDTGIGGVTVSLVWDQNNDGVDASDPIITVTTAANGTYSFDHLLAGTYHILETQPTGFGEGTENTTDEVVLTVPTASTINSSVNFGNTTGSLTGRVFSDDNDSGTQDGTETGIAGVDVTLEWTGADGVFGTADDRSVTVQTDANGDYVFNYATTAGLISGFGDTTGGLLSNGFYRITETQPTGFVDGAETVGNASVNPGGVDEGTHAGLSGRGADQIGVDGNYIQIVGGEDSTGYTFGELPASSISGSVFIDGNNNGSRQPNEKGIANVTITLTGTNDLGDAVSLTTTTDANGNYKFDTLRPGTYMLLETQPKGVNDGKETPGTAGGGLAGNDIIGNIVLPIGTSATAYDFGETEIPPVIPPVEPSKPEKHHHQPKPEAPIFAFDSFHNFALAPEGLGWPSPLSSPNVFRAPLLPIEPIYSGAANPGATLVIEIYNTVGVRIGSQTVIADAGGNWLADFSSANLTDTPGEIRITQTPAPYSVGVSGGSNFRAYYTPAAINPGHFVGSSATDLLNDDPAPLLGGLNLANPLQFGPVKYGGELLSTEGTAAGN